MAKGSGRGSGGAGGALTAAIGRVNAMGVRNANYLREGMRPLDAIRAAFAAVASTAEANRVATRLPPVRVLVEGRRVILQDGRHRLAAAAEAGATRIRATVVTHVRGVRAERTVNVSIRGSKR